MLEQRIQQQFFESADLKYQAAEVLGRPIEEAVAALVAGLTAGGRVLVAGLGASASLAQLVTSELIGCFERDRPGLAALALAPLLFEADMPGAEILHPVAVVIILGLTTSTLLDSFLTPAMVALFGAKPIADLLQIFVKDHGKPMSIEGAKAKVTLLNGKEKTEAELLPAGDKLEAKGSFKVAKGTKGIAVLTLVGKPPTTGRFQIK